MSSETPWGSAMEERLASSSPQELLRLRQVAERWSQAERSLARRARHPRELLGWGLAGVDRWGLLPQLEPLRKLERARWLCQRLRASRGAAGRWLRPMRGAWALDGLKKPWSVEGMFTLIWMGSGMIATGALTRGWGAAGWALAAMGWALLERAGAWIWIDSSHRVELVELGGDGLEGLEKAAQESLGVEGGDWESQLELRWGAQARASLKPGWGRAMRERQLLEKEQAERPRATMAAKRL